MKEYLSCELIRFPVWFLLKSFWKRVLETTLFQKGLSQPERSEEIIFSMFFYVFVISEPS